MNIIITTIIKKVAWYGESKHKLIYPCPIGNTEEKHETTNNKTDSPTQPSGHSQGSMGALGITLYRATLLVIQRKNNGKQRLNKNGL